MFQILNGMYLYLHENIICCLCEIQILLGVLDFYLLNLATPPITHMVSRTPACSPAVISSTDNIFLPLLLLYIYASFRTPSISLAKPPLLPNLIWMLLYGTLGLCLIIYTNLL